MGKFVASQACQLKSKGHSAPCDEASNGISHGRNPQKSKLFLNLATNIFFLFQ